MRRVDMPRMRVGQLLGGASVVAVVRFVSLLAQLSSEHTIYREYCYELCSIVQPC